MIVKTLTEQNHLILKKVKSYENLRNNSIKKKKKKPKANRKEDKPSTWVGWPAKNFPCKFSCFCFYTLHYPPSLVSVKSLQSNHCTKPKPLDLFSLSPYITIYNKAINFLVILFTVSTSTSVKALALRFGLLWVFVYRERGKD